MVEKIYNKLARDKIPEIVSAQGHMPYAHTLSDIEFRAALKQKLVEEAGEAAATGSKETLLLELADLLQVIESLTVAVGFTLADLRRCQEMRREQRGGFEKRIFLEKVDEKDVV